MIKYKTFTAKVEYDSDDEIFWGEILGTADKILFEAENIDEVKAQFHEAIDDYLEMCEEIRKTPC
jgi:predicted HicB family RNase H-like nuclease